jgi:hypothetical protein
MGRFFAFSFLSSMLMGGSVFVGPDPPSADSIRRSRPPVSFRAEVMPIFRKECLPCHAEESYNRSGLSLDSYELVMAGGNHGAAVVPGDPDASLLVQKIGAQPPFGEKMPIALRGDRSRTHLLTEEEIAVISEWIAQGAHNN